MLSIALLGACSGGGGSGGAAPAAPIAQISGTWRITEEITTASGPCAGEVGNRASYDLSVSQNGNNITVVSPAGTFSGTLNGNRIEWRGSYPEDGGTTTITSMNVTYTATSLAGTTNWTWSNGSSSCSGTTRVDGSRSSPAHIAGTVTLVPTTEFDDFVVVVRESGSGAAPSRIDPVGEYGDMIVLPAGLWDIGLVFGPGFDKDRGAADAPGILWMENQRVVGGENLILVFGETD
jgi:hypothetical protein